MRKILVLIGLLTFFLSACGGPLEVEVTFETNGGSTISSMIFNEKSPFTLPNDPIKEGFTFDGWYLDETLNNPFSVEGVLALEPEGTLTIYASWMINQYTITFDSNGGSEIASITDYFDSEISGIENPTKEGYSFQYWYLENNINFPSKMPAENITVYAFWKINKYNISFFTYENILVTSITEDYGTNIIIPDEPTREGYTFNGWDANVPTIMPSENLTLTATWTINAYTITFDTDGGSAVSAITQNYDTTVTIPSAPTKEGYTFGGWSETVPTRMPAENQTLIATWTINAYTITFDTDGGSAVNEITQDYATEVTTPSDPIKDGFIFVSWDQIIPTIMPANNITINANWIIDDSYFYGNIFQIITYDLGKIPISTGSGFVFNSDGWFISNAHVFEGAYFSDAFFNIIDYSEGSNYTKLGIELISYYNNSKDLIIGKITNYSKISEEFYKNIEFYNGYEIGDTTYSVGYPYSSIKLEVNEGLIIEDISSLSDKVISGISYIGSSSFIAPGSSGGVLINENLDVIGITTIGLYLNDDFILGGSIETLNFLNIINQQNEEMLVDISEKLNPNEIDFIRLIKTFYNSQAKNLEQILFENYRRFIFRWEVEDTNNSGVSYSYEDILAIDTDGYIQYYSEYKFDNGDKRKEEFYGFYNSNIIFDKFTYKFTYRFSNGNSYTLTSAKINYSTNINLTLFEYTLSKSPSSFIVSANNIEYAKKLFNSTYSWLYSLIYD
jgi:uncharacterized repeat protein (TIGR02543 family)